LSCDEQQQDPESPQFIFAIMSEGNVKPPTNPVVAEAHQVDTFRKFLGALLNQSIENANNF
jgi:hypothetical protein